MSRWPHLSPSDDWDVTVQSCERVDRSGVEVSLANRVTRWLTTDWPRERVDRCSR